MFNLARNLGFPLFRGITLSQKLLHSNFGTFSRKFLPIVSSFQPPLKINSTYLPVMHKLFLEPKILDSSCPTRTVTKFSLKTGKKRSVKAVLKRFFRLDTGLWIRRRSGCHKKIHKRSEYAKFNLRQHVVCTKSQCIMFDKMVTDTFKKKKYYIDDPYEPYQVRHNLDWVLPPLKSK